ncbi:condensin-2 complex subunit G2-like [Dysidea avara]|uniref:condensin-2 complex subunit G2-like n=1 Tax=Dysidea avara TaxID=196820 RepID=UPI00332BAD5E
MKKASELTLLLANALDDTEEFLSLINRHKARNDAFDLAERLQVFAKKDLIKVWEAGLNTVRKILEILGTVTINQEEAEKLLNILDGILELLNCYVSLEAPHVTKELRHIISDLHDSLLTIPDVHIQNSISLVCEKWWSKGLADKDLLVANTIPYLVSCAVSNVGTAAVVKRLCAMKDAFQVLDFDDPSSEQLKAFMLQCFITTVILKSEQGRKFLSSLFYLSTSYTVSIHEAIKQLLPECSTQDLNWYGEIYFNAWKNAEPPYVEVIENQCLQDLMYSAVHAPRTGVRSLFHCLHSVLACVHKHITQRNVITMLVKLYGPFLWRSLKVANSDVRTNAAILLLEVFPLQDHYNNKQEQEEALHKQFTIMKELLEDPSVTVRVVAIKGVCRVLCYYWELVPVTVIKQLLTKLVSDLCYDVSSDAVRIAVLQGMCVIMDNLLSVPVMKELLPLLNHCIHDTSEKVRIAFCELLLVVKGMKSIKFWKVCPMEVLIARMECDTANVAKRIAALVIDSFQGPNVDLTQQVDRCVYLLQTCPGAARRFYQLAQTHLSSANAARLILAINQFLVQVIEQGDAATATSSHQLNGNEDMDASENGGSEMVTINDTSVICGLLEIIVILWYGNRQQFDKPSHKSIKNQLVSAFTTSHSLFYQSLSDDGCRAAIFLLASHLPKRHVKLPMDVPKLPREQAIAVLQALLAWKQTEPVLKQISDWLDCSMKMGGTSEPAQAPKRRGKRKAKGSKTTKEAAIGDVPHPQIALDQLEWLMTHPVCYDSIKSSSTFCSLQDRLQGTMDLIEQRCGGTTTPDNTTDGALAQMFSVYIKMLMHQCLETKDGDKFNQSMEGVWQWYSRILLPTTNQLSDVVAMSTRQARKRSVDHTSSLPMEVMKTLLWLLSEMLLVGLGDSNLHNLIGRVLVGVADQSMAQKVWLQLCKLFYQLTESCSIQEEGLQIKVAAHQPLLPPLEKMLAALMTVDDATQYNQMFTTMKPCLVLIMADSVKFASYFSTRTSHDHQTILAMVHSLLQSMTNHIKVTPGCQLAVVIDKLPQQPASLLRLLCGSVVYTKLLLHNITKILEEGVSGDHVILLLISVLHLLPSSLAKYRTATIITEGKKLLSLVDDRLQVTANTAEKSQEVEQAQTLLLEVREKLYQLE